MVKLWSFADFGVVNPYNSKGFRLLFHPAGISDHIGAEAPCACLHHAAHEITDCNIVYNVRQTSGKTGFLPDSNCNIFHDRIQLFLGCVVKMWSIRKPGFVHHPGRSAPSVITQPESSQSELF
jgi:hypothetical protein